MGWFTKSPEEVEREAVLARLNEEAEKRKREAIESARSTVYQLGDELQFPTQEIDVRFYNHLFTILVDYKKRIEELEKQVLEKRID